jgi:YHS domain-containing protein
MKQLFLVPVALFIAAGCNQTQTAAPAAPVAKATAAAPVKLTATQELAKYCRVCVVDKGEKMEEFLPTRLNLKSSGQTYKFCSEPCRKNFDANPKKYQLPQTNKT